MSDLLEELNKLPTNAMGWRGVPMMGENYFLPRSIAAYVLSLQMEIESLRSSQKANLPDGSVRNAAFWVLEWEDHPGDVKSPLPRYWSGNDMGWVYEISDAVQFCRKRDVEQYKARTRLSGKPAEHMFVALKSETIPE